MDVPLPQQNTARSNTANPRKRPATGRLQSSTQKSIHPSAEESVHRRLAQYEEYINGQIDDFIRHDPATEELPNLPIYHSEFLKAEHACLKIPQDYLMKLKADEDPQLVAALKPRLAAVLENYQSVPESVAVVGKIGQAHSKVAYEANIEVIDARTCQASVRQHLHNIIMDLGKGKESVRKGNDQGSESVIVLQNLFSNRREFASEDAILAFLGYYGNTRDSQWQARQEKAIDYSIEWAEERRRKTTTLSKIYATNVTELWNRLKPFGNDQTTVVDMDIGFNPTLLVEKIEIFGDFRIRYSVGDCPGFEDINKDRVTKANRYLQHSRVVIFVEDVIRAGASDFLKRFLQDRRKRRPGQHIIVVLSKGDTGLDPADRTETSFDRHEVADLDWLSNRKGQVKKEQSGTCMMQPKDLDSKTFRANLDCRKPQLNSMFKIVDIALKSLSGRMGGYLTEDNHGEFFPEAMEKHYTAAARAKKRRDTTLARSRLQTLWNGVSGIDGPYTVFHTKFLSI
ncbi:hypothetical protein ACET3X_001880 [Alternaria dauci]|uniref:Uncharacterized protein n=1 Tax=Alternaria dauci TaxID=48095 RepID=A0ABR3UZJ6_9PLEO